MWTQTGIIFVILCTKSKQSLRTELVRDERSSEGLLGILMTRIVNAIALQSSSIQKTVKIREVITELLQANTESFAIVTKNDLSKFRPELEDLETRLKSIASDYPNGKSTFDDINKIMPMLNKATNFNRFKKGIGSHVQTFLDHINDIHFKNNFIACDSTVVENAKKYYDLSDKKDIVSLYTNEDKQTVKTLKDNSDKLKMCMQNFKNYGRKVREPFDDEYETIGDILLMRQNIDKINNASELENLGNYVNTLMSMATKLESSMKQEKITTVGKMLERGIQHLKTIAETKNGPAHSLTAGFLEVDDLIKVSADLKSDWFKKEISRGKSTEELEKSLHGFFEFGERMVKLRERWKNFQAEFSASSDELEITAKMLIVVEDRSQHIDVDALHSLNNTVSSCYANVTLEPGNRNFTNFDIEKLVFEKMNTLVHDVQNWVDKVVLTIDPDVINHFLDDLNSHTFSTKDVSEMVQEVAQLHVRTVNAFGLVFGISIAIFIVVAIIGIVGYGLTASGRERYRKLYFYYFPKPKEFAKRWRYSLFMDRVDGKNALLEGVREIHKEHVLKAVKRGVYINVYANFPPELGNTALHLATKRAYPEIVDILIRYGADRTLLNAQNKTPEQMIPSDYRENQKEKIARFEQVEKIYKKYRKKKFRLHVPDLFPNTSFHIYIDGRTDDELTNAFTDKFQAISSDGFLPTTTHCIVKTDKEGLLETDDLKILLWIFSGVIIVKDSWMTECLKNEDLINHDADFLVEKVKYKGVVYDTVTQWTTAMAKGAMPYLYGFYVAVVVPGYENIALLSNIVMMHGGVMLDKFPDKEEYNIGSRPYLHVNTSPLFVIHDGTVNLDHYKNDPDKMYTLFTEQEFIMFMLKRDVHVNPNPNPPPVAINGLID